MSGLITQGADIPVVLALHFAWNAGRSWALPGLHNVIFGSGGAALAQIHLFQLPQSPGQMIAAGLEPATVGSEVQRSSIEPRDHAVDIPGSLPFTHKSGH